MCKKKFTHHMSVYGQPIAMWSTILFVYPLMISFILEKHIHSKWWKSQINIIHRFWMAFRKWQNLSSIKEYYFLGYLKVKLLCWDHSCFITNHLKGKCFFKWIFLIDNCQTYCATYFPPNSWPTINKHSVKMAR